MLLLLASSLLENYLAPIPTSSTVKYRVAFGGIIPPAPRAPYPSDAGIIKFLLPPTFKFVNIPSSHPAITCRTPTCD